MCFVKHKEMNSRVVTQQRLLIDPHCTGIQSKQVLWVRFGPNPPPTSASLCRMSRYLSSSREEAAKNIPMLFVSCPSTKDPTWEMRHPGKDWSPTTHTLETTWRLGWVYGCTQGVPPHIAMVRAAEQVAHGERSSRGLDERTTEATRGELWQCNGVMRVSRGTPAPTLSCCR